MALSRKGWRTLRIGHRPLYWRSRAVRNPTDDAALEVCVVSSQAFKPGKTGQELVFLLPRGSHVGPAVVRYVVENTTQFTGAAGLPHATPSRGVLANARVMALSGTVC